MQGQTSASSAWLRWRCQLWAQERAGGVREASLPLSSDALHGACDLGGGLWTGGSRRVDLGTVVTVALATAVGLCVVSGVGLLTATACHVISAA